MKKYFPSLKWFCMVLFMTSILACNQDSKEAAKYDYFTSYDQYFGFVPEDFRVIKTNSAHSGNYVSKMDTAFPYNLGLVRKWGELTDKNIREISVDCYVYPTQVNQPIYIVCAFEHPGNPTPLYYEYFDITKDLKQANTWQKVSAVFYLPKSIDTNSALKLLLWNQGKTTAYVDDFGVKFSEINN